MARKRGQSIMGKQLAGSWLRRERTSDVGSGVDESDQPRVPLVVGVSLDLGNS
jgi:hypothetical protein